MEIISIFIKLILLRQPNRYDASAITVSANQQQHDFGDDEPAWQACQRDHTG